MNYNRKPDPPGRPTPTPPPPPRKTVIPPPIATSSTNMKRERPRPPSPSPTVCTTVLSRPRPPSPAPSTTTTIAPIRIRPMSALMDPDEQMSTVTSANPGLTSSRGDPFLHQEEEDTRNDWRCKQKSISDRLKYALENDNTYQDVIFEVGKEKNKVKAHQFILRIASPIFDRLLQDTVESPGQPNSSQKEKVIPVPDIEPETFRSLLKFIYTDEINRRASDRRMLALLKASKLFGVLSLYEKCKRLLLKGICNEIAIDLYEFSTFGMMDKDLMDLACTHIADNAFAVFGMEQFQRLSEENLGRLLDRDDLNIDEMSVFLSVVQWAQSKCKERQIPSTPTNLRMVVDDIIYKIRFPLITAEEMVLQVRKTNMLTSDEHVQIMDYICVKEPEKRKELPPIPFSTAPRKSRKNLMLDYGKSPGGAGSSAAAECIEITSSSSEESEVASAVSAPSEGNPAKKKLKRAHSTSSSKKPKRRRRHSEADQFKFLFGDESCGRRELAVVNKEISLNDYIDQVSTFDYLDDIQAIVFENVKILDFKSLRGKKIEFPNLETFKMNIKTEEATKTLLQDDNFQLEKLLFFSTGSDWLYKDVFDTEIGITIIINNVIVLKVNHGCAHVTLNKFNGAQNILKSLRQKSIKSLVYSHADFNEKHFPPTLCRLVLLSSIINNINCMNEFLKNFSHLKELTIYPPVSGGATSASIPLMFDSKLKCHNKLKICGLRGFKISIERSFKLPKMTALYLWASSFDRTFEENFHHIFPCLTEGFFITMKCSPKLLKNTLKISSLREIISWNADWELSDSDASDIHQRYKVPVRTEKSFCLTKQNDGSWEYAKLNYDGFQQNMFKKFQYEFLYPDYQTFKNCS